MTQPMLPFGELAKDRVSTVDMAAMETTNGDGGDVGLRRRQEAWRVSEQGRKRKRQYLDCGFALYGEPALCTCGTCRRATGGNQRTAAKHAAAAVGALAP